jgi:hypothetical protein
MPLFYFHIRDRTAFIEDAEGYELPDMEAARHLAVKSARSMMAEDLRGGELNLASSIQVEDHTHSPLLTLIFAEAVTITGHG